MLDIGYIARKILELTKETNMIAYSLDKDTKQRWKDFESLLEERIGPMVAEFFCGMNEETWRKNISESKELTKEQKKDIFFYDKELKDPASFHHAVIKYNNGFFSIYVDGTFVLLENFMEQMQAVYFCNIMKWKVK